MIISEYVLKEISLLMFEFGGISIETNMRKLQVEKKFERKIAALGIIYLRVLFEGLTLMEWIP